MFFKEYSRNGYRGSFCRDWAHRDVDVATSVLYIERYTAGKDGHERRHFFS